jgi:hypothetical protein
MHQADWNRVFLDHTRDRRITFRSASLYAFESMQTFVEIACA